MPNHFLITGPPGCRKTTFIRAVLARLGDRRAPVRGFWTEEVRRRGARTGFRIETVAGETGTIARVGLRSRHRVGRYGVDLAGFESVGAAELDGALEDAARGEPVILVIDEIGRMELLSERFRRSVGRAFCEVPQIVATIMQRKHAFADALKSRPDVRLITLTHRNRADLPADVARQLL